MAEYSAYLRVAAQTNPDWCCLNYVNHLLVKTAGELFEHLRR
jgi:hypothetical protein